MWTKRRKYVIKVKDTFKDDKSKTKMKISLKKIKLKEDEDEKFEDEKFEDDKDS